MQVGNSASAMRGFQVYAKAAYTDRLQEAAASQQQAATRTRSMGFSLGKFGVRYETEEPIDQSAQQAQQESAAAAQPQTQTVPHDLHTQGLRNQALSAYAGLPEPSSHQRRAGSNAYMQASAAYQEQQAPRMLNASV